MYTFVSFRIETALIRFWGREGTINWTWLFSKQIGAIQGTDLNFAIMIIIIKIQCNAYFTIEWNHEAFLSFHSARSMGITKSHSVTAWMVAATTHLPVYETCTCTYRLLRNYAERLHHHHDVGMRKNAYIIIMFFISISGKRETTPAAQRQTKTSTRLLLVWYYATVRHLR